MPSGAKKRKAAKKKQQHISNIHETHQGNGDSSKSQDSDSSDVNSPTGSQEHQNPLRKEDEDLVVTKEVDFESRIVNIESVKEPNVEILKEGERNGGNSNEEVDKKIEYEPPKIVEIESKEGAKRDFNAVEILPAVDPIDRVVSSTREVIQAVPVKVNPAQEIGDSSIIDSQLNDKEEIVLPTSNGTSGETSIVDCHPIESRARANSDNQKGVVRVPPTVQSSSWKSCCGLFDVLTSSDR